MNYLRGEKVFLRAMEMEDLDLMYDMENDPSMWDITNFTVPYSKYHLRQFIQNSQCDMFADLQLRLVIADADDERMVGTIDVFDYSPRHRRGELGIAIKNEYRGMGMAKEAMQLMSKYLFDFLQFQQLTAHIPLDNISSLELFKSCGFQESGILKKWWNVESEWKDVCLLQCFNPRVE